MQRPDLATLACVNTDCQHVGRPGQGHLTIRKVYGQDGIHLKVIRGKAQLLHILSLLGYEKINTSSVERHNGTSRLHNQRKVRKTLAFSKSHLYHGWMSWLSVVPYNFCRLHGSLRIKDASGLHHRTPHVATAQLPDPQVTLDGQRVQNILRCTTLVFAIVLFHNRAVSWRPFPEERPRVGGGHPRFVPDERPMGTPACARRHAT